VEDKNVRVPFVVWTHTTKRALTLENVWAIKISDYEAITAEGIDRSEVASLLLNIYLKQIFEDGFFHADPHPGNLFIYPIPGGRSENEGSQSWQLTFVDFGMVGRVPPKTKEGLREMIIGIGFQDADRVVKAYQMLDVLLPNADLELLAQAEAKAFEQFWGKNMSELQQLDTQELREFTKEYRELVYTMPFQIPQDIIFLGRAIGILSGMCTGLDPEFNVWNHIAPFAEKMLVDDAKKEPYIWLENAKNIFQALLLMPMKIDATLAKMEKGEIAVKTPDVSLQVSRLEMAVRRFVGGIIFAALLLGGVQLHISGHTFYAGILFVGSGVSLLWIIFVGRQP
jgi:predicted unusual protein kinase regulating ubiquinone biosynthesis (AarF/ABC1/UbiB family)